jgi:hypothetical protein
VVSESNAMYEMLNDMTDAEYDEYMNYKLEIQELADHVKVCKAAAEDRHCKICLEY